MFIEKPNFEDTNTSPYYSKNLQKQHQYMEN